MRRRIDHRLGGADLHKLAGIHDGYSVGDLDGHTYVVRETAIPSPCCSLRNSRMIWIRPSMRVRAGGNKRISARRVTLLPEPDSPRIPST
jgi:hypothetical protein